MAKAEKRTRTTGRLMNEGSKPLISDVTTSFKPKEGIKAKSYNMVIPLLTMVIMMPVNLAYTGWSKVENADSFLNHVYSAIGNGSGSSSVLYAVISSILVAMILYRAQGIMKLKEMVDLILKGISELMPLALLSCLPLLLAMLVTH